MWQHLDQKRYKKLIYWWDGENSKLEYSQHVWNWAWPHWESWSVPILLTELAGSIKPQKSGIYKALISDSRGSTQSLKKSHNNKLNNMMFEKCLLTGLHSPENNWASGWTCCLQGKWWLTRHWKRASEINGPLLLHWKGLIVNSTVPGIHSKVPHSSLYFSFVSNTKSIKYRLKVLLFPKQFHVIHALDPSYKVGFN